ITTPLMKLRQIQQELHAGIKLEHDELEKATDLKELQGKRKDLELQIANLELDHDRTVAESEKEHAFYAREKSKEVQEKLVSPLKELKAVLEIEVTEHYVAQQLEMGVQKIELPQEAKDLF